MNYWLLKSEPETFSWQEQEKAGVEPWDGVRNYQARNNMKIMKTGDLALFYHSGSQRAVVGIVEIVKEHYPDEDERFVIVDVKAVRKLSRDVTLGEIKKNTNLSEIALVKQSRLSVMKLSENEFKEIINMSENS